MCVVMNRIWLTGSTDMMSQSRWVCHTLRINWCHSPGVCQTLPSLSTAFLLQHLALMVRWAFLTGTLSLWLLHADVQMTFSVNRHCSLVCRQLLAELMIRLCQTLSTLTMKILLPVSTMMSQCLPFREPVKMRLSQVLKFSQFFKTIFTGFIRPKSSSALQAWLLLASRLGHTLIMGPFLPHLKQVHKCHLLALSTSSVSCLLLLMGIPHGTSHQFPQLIHCLLAGHPLTPCLSEQLPVPPVVSVCWLAQEILRSFSKGSKVCRSWLHQINAWRNISH